MKCPNCYALQDKIKILEAEIDRLKTIDVKGWHGKDKIEFSKEGTEWIIVEHRKDKESGKVATITHRIPESNVKEVWDMIKARCKLNESTTSKHLALDIITKMRLPVSLDEFWGGKYRTKYLFFLLYHPLKILEEKGLIRYGGRGNVLRLVP